MVTVLIIVGIWLLVNVLFVVVMAPPRKPRKVNPTSHSDASLAPARISKERYPLDEEEEFSIRHVIVSVGLGAFFVLSPPIAQAIDFVKRAFQKSPTK
ncbi:MAG TPA: hypothetical protein VK603_21885 [Candidatus Saccharimonadales bacterium]|jgi:hypothetical protein|nr:hypothetical protein [Candidatus Saccharimonadales bacterium]